MLVYGRPVMKMLFVAVICYSTTKYERTGVLLPDLQLVLAN